MTDKICYLDNSATTFPCEKAKEMMINAIENNWGNPSSFHEKGIEAYELLRKAREAVASSLSADKDEIFFTSGGTEGNNLLIFGSVEKNFRNGKKLITTKIEHPSVQKVFDKLEEEGFTVVRLSTDKFGMISLEELEKEVDEKTTLISTMYVNNEVGTIEPVSEIKNIVKKKNSPALIHVDAVQAYGKIPINVRKLGVDLLTVSSHKIHGPKGVGAVYIKKGTKLAPLVFGGGQEKDIRPGTEPMPLIAGFLGAVQSLKINESFSKVKELRDYFCEKAKEIDGLHINSSEEALPYIINIYLEKLNSETVLNFLSDSGVYVSAGSACSKGHKSPVLTALGLSDEVINSSLRLSLSRYTEKEELDKTLELLKKASKILHKRR